jgi:hypothetical protein
MKRKLLAQRPSPAMVVALVALVFSLTGGAVAATLIDGGDIENGSITKEDLHKNSVNGKKVQNKTLKADDFAAGELKEGVQGIPGLHGDKGEPGEDGTDGADGADATALWAVIRDDGTTARGSHVTSSARNSEGFYTVTFDRDVSGCAYVPAIGGPDDSVPKALIGAARHPSNVNAVNIDTFAYDTGGFQSNSFHLAVFC